MYSNFVTKWHFRRSEKLNTWTLNFPLSSPEVVQFVTANTPQILNKKNYKAQRAINIISSRQIIINEWLGGAFNIKGSWADEIIIILSVADERLMMNHKFRKTFAPNENKFLQNSVEHLLKRKYLSFRVCLLLKFQNLLSVSFTSHSIISRLMDSFLAFYSHRVSTQPIAERLFPKHFWLDLKRRPSITSRGPWDDSLKCAIIYDASNSHYEFNWAVRRSRRCI